MSNLLLNTGVLEQGISKLKEEKIYFYNKKSSFSGFSSPSALARYVAYIGQIYGDISNNISKVENLIDEYKTDVEGVEKKLTNGYGTIINPAVNNVVNEISFKGTNPFIREKIDASNLFLITKYTGDSTGDVSGIDYSKYTDYYKQFENYTMADWMMYAYNPDKYSPEAVKETGATLVMAAGTTPAFGVLKFLEKVWDGLDWMVGLNYEYDNNMYNQGLSDETIKGLQDATKERIAVDQTEKLKEGFYEDTKIGRNLNEASEIKYNSIEATGIQNVFTKITEIVTATAATLVTGGSSLLAIPIGFAMGAGKSAENAFQGKPESDLYTHDIALDGVIGAAQYASTGKMTANLLNGFTKAAGAVKGFDTAYNAAKESGMTNIQAAGETLKKFSETFHLNQVGEFISSNTLGDSLKLVGKGAIRTLYDKDVILGTTAFLADDVKSCIEKEEVTLGDAKGALKQFGNIYLINLGANVLGAFGEAFGGYVKNVESVVDLTDDSNSNYYRLIIEEDGEYRTIFRKTSGSDDISRIVDNTNGKVIQIDALEKDSYGKVVEDIIIDGVETEISDHSAAILKDFLSDSGYDTSGLTKEQLIKGSANVLAGQRRIDFDKLKLSSVITKNGYKIESYGEDSENLRKLTSRVESVLEEIPNELKSKITPTIRVYDSDWPEDIFRIVEYNDPNFRAGASINKEYTAIGYYISSLDVDDLTGITIHELAHNVDVKYGITSGNIWLEAINRDGISAVNEYAKSALESTGYIGEDFAESVRYYFGNHDDFLKKFPNRASALKTIFMK